MAVGVSVVIPCYNASKYVYRCLDSFCFDYSDYEMIFVDDCSTDDTVELIKQYIQDKKINARLYVNDSNLGPGPTRNRGIELAEKEYVSFVDIDDTVKRDYFTAFSGVASKGYDCIVFDAIRKKENKESRMPMFLSQKIKAGEVEKKEALVYVWPSPYSKFYKTSMLRDNQIMFPSVMRGEDYGFGKMAIGCSNRVYYLPIEIYNYHDNAGSLVHRKELVNEQDRIVIFEMISEKLKGRNLSKEINELYFYSVIFSIVNEMLKSNVSIKECLLKYKELEKNYTYDNSYLWKYDIKYKLYFILLKAKCLRMIKFILACKKAVQK